jgi:hypothetical protein
MKRLKLWIIALAIKRVPQLAITLVQLAAAKVALGGIMSEDAETMMWEHVTAGLVILLTATAQWAGSKWAGTAIVEAQEALGTKPDGLPSTETRAAARSFKSAHPAK